MRTFLTLLSLCLLAACAQRGPVKTAEALPPAHVDLAARGRELAKAGDYVRAEQYLAGALEAGGEVDAILPALLRVCVASERYEAALAYTERYEPEASDSPELELVLAALQLGLGQVENERRSLELGLVLDGLCLIARIATNLIELLLFRRLLRTAGDGKTQG